MATYYRWRKRSYSYSYKETMMPTGTNYIASKYGNSMYYISGYNPGEGLPSINSDGTADFSNANELTIPNYTVNPGIGYYALIRNPTTFYYFTGSNTLMYQSGQFILSNISAARTYTIEQEFSADETYVYSDNALAYPNGGVSGSYYYDQRTTITSPTAPTGLAYPNPVTSTTVTVTWNQAASNVPDYQVDKYEVSRFTDKEGSWHVVGETSNRQMIAAMPTGATSIQFRVRAKDTNGQYGNYVTGETVMILQLPTIAVPAQSMQGQDITINWTAVDTATGYTLQRKADTDDDWVEVYSGNALTFTETVGSWTSVQYRVQGTFSSGAGGWITSVSIPIVSSSALVISGQNEDLGTLTEDVHYSISTDTGNEIHIDTYFNEVLVNSQDVADAASMKISIFDLPIGDGKIKIVASVNNDDSSVSMTRIWQYNKTPISFPNSGAIATAMENGQVRFPITLAEAVRVPEHLGGSLAEMLNSLSQYTTGGLKIETGNYIGTGTHGADNPNTITAIFKPKFAIIYFDFEDTYLKSGMGIITPFHYMGTYSSSYGSGSTFTTVGPASISGNAISWHTIYSYSASSNGITWNSSSPATQFNQEGVTYHYIVIG